MSDWRRMGWLGGALLAGFWLRMHALGRESLWLDEAYTWLVTLPNWAGVWQVMLSISDVSPLAYLVTRLATPALGRSEFALRLPMVFAAMLALPVTYRLGRALFGRGAGLWAVAWLALSPFAVWYARDARPYGLYLLAATAALWGFWRWAAQGRGPGLMVLASAALYLTHYGGALYALAITLYCLLQLRRQPRLFRRWFLWQALAALPTGLYVLAFLAQRQPLTANNWIPRPTLLAPLHTLLNFLTADAGELAGPGLAVLAAALGLLVVAARRPGRARALLLLWLTLPPLAVLLLSFRLPAYVDRFFFPSSVAVALLTGAAVQWARALPGPARAGIALGAAAMLIAALAGSLRLYRDPLYAKEDWRGAAARVQAALPGARLLAQDAEALLGLRPYLELPAELAQATPAELEALAGPAVVIVRSLDDSGHRLSKSALFDPLTAGPLAPWFAAHPERVRAVWRLAGVAVVELP